MEWILGGCMLKYYLNVPIACIHMHSYLMPFQQIINNGTTISLQDERLIEQLIANENDRNSEVIDWHLFKGAHTILVDNYGDIFGCTTKTHGFVELRKLKFYGKEKEKFLNKHNIE